MSNNLARDISAISRSVSIFEFISGAARPEHLCALNLCRASASRYLRCFSCLQS